MKKISKQFILALVGFCVILLLFLLLFFHISKLQQKRVDVLIKTSVSDCRESFSNYLSSPSQENYLLGVSSFYLLKSLYPESSYYNSEFNIVISNPYAKLLFINSLDPGEIQQLIDALDALAVNISDITGYTLLQIFVDYSNYT